MVSEHALAAGEPQAAPQKARDSTIRTVVPVQPSNPPSDPRKARETGLYETMPFRLNQTTYKTPKDDEFNIIA